MDLDVRPVIEAAVRSALPSVVIGKFDIVLGEDHNDEEAWFVAVEVPPATPPVGGDRLLAAVRAASNALTASGDRRFPYIRIRYLGEAEPDEGEAPGSSNS